MKDCVENAAIYVGAARICNAGIANADPIIVCGRVNLHKTDKKDGFLPSLLEVDVIAGDAVEDASDKEGSLVYRGNCGIANV